jgi:hypothetical protein
MPGINTNPSFFGRIMGPQGNVGPSNGMAAPRHPFGGMPMPQHPHQAPMGGNMPMGGVPGMPAPIMPSSPGGINTGPSNPNMGMSMPVPSGSMGAGFAGPMKPVGAPMGLPNTPQQPDGILGSVYNRPAPSANRRY